jgi:hypothetical protein
LASERTFYSFRKEGKSSTDQLPLLYGEKIA